MALWLFRRKTRRKRSRATLSDSEGADRGRDIEKAPMNRRQTDPAECATTTTTRISAQQQKKQRTERNKLHRRERAYSFSPGRNDSIRVDPAGGQKRKHESVPVTSNPKGNPRAAHSRYASDKMLESGLGTLGEDVFPRAPTLHNKRDAEHSMPRKKSSKRRRKADQAREAEIKALSNAVPVRPAADPNWAGRTMRKESRRVKTGFIFPFGKPESDKENRSSDVSLPLAESLHSSLSSDSDHIAYKVSAFEALAPRPKLSYAIQPRGGTEHPSGNGSLPARMPSHRRRLSEKTPYPEATLKAHKRVDDLANDLSASDLRELMERDQRRRERKKVMDQEKVERRLARRAEKQRSDEELAAQAGTEPPKNLERGVLGRELVGLGIDPASAIVTSSKPRASGGSMRRKASPSLAKEVEIETDAQTHPAEIFHRMTSFGVDQAISPSELKEPVLPQVPPKPRGFLRSKKSRSKSPPAPQPSKDTPETLQKGSESDSAKGAMSWASFFRWGNKNKRNSGPSSFSNTSRDSMPPVQQPVQVTFVPPGRSSAGMPKRTMSRFREDLPELPRSPPESRVQSSTVEPIPPTIAEQSPPPNDDDQIDEMQMSSSPTTAHAAQYDDTPTSLNQSMEDELRDTPTSWSRREELQPSPAPHSMSLASIDSEGSWLSGRFGGRRRSSGVPDNLSRVHNHRREGYGGGSIGSQEQEHDPEGTNEEHSIADDEYLSRYAHHSGSDTRWKRQSTGEARPSSDEDEQEARWGSVRGLQPTMIHSSAMEQMKSREGLLNTFGEEEDDEVEEVQGRDSEEHAVQRATSINLGRGHARHISAGSARLLDLTPRSSVDAKRRSIGGA